MVFRRISKNARRFSIVKTDTLEVFNDKLLDKHHKSYRGIIPNGDIPKNACPCPRHGQSVKVRFKFPLKMKLYASVGDIKG